MGLRGFQVARGRRICAIFALLCGCLAATIAPLRAQTVEEFYTGRIVTLYIGYTVGGAYDLYGRLLARHIGRHIPGQPTIVPVNMEGAGSLKLMNWLYNAAPRDGSAFGTVNQSAAFVPLVGVRELARYDPSKFTWIGSANEEISVCVAWKRTGITQFDQLYDQELIIGSTGAGADEYALHALVRHVLGAKLRSVVGYAGGNEMNFAMERGETDGRCGWAWSSVKTTRPQWLEDGTIQVLLQFGLRKHPELPDVPLIMDLAKSEEDRRVLRLVLVNAVFGRPFVAPPDLPADRAAALEAAFEATMKDPEFLADARRLNAEITPVSGETLDRLLAETYATAPEVIERTRALLK
jgi:tripartite-type tricarboxylate transporter receptor subunit TctC